MSVKQFDVLLFIGRFQPVHNAHLDIIKRAMSLADEVVVVIGSAEQPRTVKNPFTAKEREQMIRSALWQEEGIDSRGPHIHFEYNRDSPYNDQAWATRIQNIAHKHVARGREEVINACDAKIGLIGHRKEGDHSTYYLDLFPQWDFVDHGLMEPLNSTNIREIYFDPNSNLNYLKGVIPTTVFNHLESWRSSDEYSDLVEELRFIEEYKSQFAMLPYPPVFVTTDAVVIQSGHVLMIKRKAQPGKGLWALPGGFLNAESDRSLQDCMIRELKEETKIKVPVPALVGNIQEIKTFDAINRSARGRTVTTAFKIVLPAGALPKVKGADDAEQACWIPLNDLSPTNTFEDHHTIITHFTGIE